MIEKIKSIIKNNNGFLIKNIKINGDLYYLKPFDYSKFSFESVKSLYSDYYINSMVTSIVPMNDANYKKKLDHFVYLNKTYGFGLFNVCRQRDNLSVGLYGLKLRKGTTDELELAYVIKFANIVRALSEVMIPFAFEIFNIKKLHGEILSYNKASQIIVNQIGMIENGITFCDKDFIKDSYFVNFVLTKKRFNLLLSLSNLQEYKLLNISKKTNIKNLHSKARYLYDALNDFKKDSFIKKYKHCNKLFHFFKNKYPRISKLEIGN
jgi:RimJ/RimL family protein N-acetyltransferase